MTGVSHMLPLVVAGGLCIALSFVFGIEAFREEGTLAAALMQIGGTSAFALMVPMLAGFIAFSIADRPGLAPGLIGGMLASTSGAGFLGGIVAGFLAGHTAKWIVQHIRLPHAMEALKPILLIPLLSSAITGLAMIYLIGGPVATVMAAGAFSMLFGCTLMAPHGGLFVLTIPNAVGNVGMYLVAIAAGTLVTGLIYAMLKPAMVLRQA